MEQSIKKYIADAVKKNFDYDIAVANVHLERPQDTSHGDWASNVAMTLTKEIKKSPKEIAEKITDAELPDGVDMVEVAGPGFINFKVSEKHYIQNLKRLLAAPKKYGESTRLKDKTIMVEFAHPNPFKSFHIGHLRNIILGETIVRMLESQNAKVIRTNYQGDVGMHIAKCIYALEDVDPKDYPETADEKTKLLGECYAKGATAFEKDENVKKEIVTINKKIYNKEDAKINELWKLGKKWSLEKFHEIYERVYTTFEREYFESETLPFVDEQIKRAVSEGILEKSQGALIFNGEKYGLDTRVFQNSEGLPTYEGKELGLAVLKNKEYGIMDQHIHNVAVEHNSFFSVAFKVKELLWPDEFTGRQYHNAYEFVGLKKGKMSSRKGNIILGDDILNEAHDRIEKIIKERSDIKDEQEITEAAEIIGLGAIKWSFLKISPFKYLAFDMEESINFEGDSGPYIQYTYARAESILQGTKTDTTEIPEDTINSATEKALLKWLERFPEVVELASTEYMPNQICAYLLELAQKFNSFYKNSPVLKADREEDKLARLALTHATSKIIEKGLYLLGIKTVEKM